MPVLRQAIADHQRRFYGLDVDPDREVLVTAGATEALTATILALTDEGDEVVTLRAVLRLLRRDHRAQPGEARHRAAAGARISSPTRTTCAAAITDRTRLILINSPHNPTGTVLGADTLDLIVELAHQHDAIIVTDEVYEHLTFGVPHLPIATLPGRPRAHRHDFQRRQDLQHHGLEGRLADRPGAARGRDPRGEAVPHLHNGAPFQPAIAVGLGLPDAFFTGVAETLRAKRDLLSAGLLAAGFTITKPQGGYFVVADAAPLGHPDAAAFARQLPKLVGVVAHPGDRVRRTTSTGRNTRRCCASPTARRWTCSSARPPSWPGSRPVRSWLSRGVRLVADARH